ncbi:putative T7SS-secreted protein [Streptomyces cyslabdanicus]|uniref:putative T7SS-secreted protein n=1 Tax=Streptomyces cyslabdanicus TaxID=1470456 RepID=UPI004043BD39
MLDETSDPIPGDPYEVAKLGRQLRKTAEAIEKEAREIKALGSVKNWQGKAAKEFEGSSKGAGDKLRKAFKRYDEAATALGTQVRENVCSNEYASELHRAQQMADKALTDAEQAHGDLTSAQRSLDGQPDDTPKDDPDTKKYNRHKEQASSSLKAAKEALQTAKGIRDNAAKAAADAIHDVIEGDGLKDGFKDKFKNWVHEHVDMLQLISKWAGRIALWAGVLSLALGWIPVIGQVIAAIADAVALLASVVALAADLVLWLGGEGSLTSVLLDTVGLLTFGIGRAAMAGAKGAAAGTKVLARSNLYKQAIASGMKSNKAWNFVNRAIPGALRGKAGVKALEGMPKGKLPSLSNLGEGFSPRSIYKDTVEGVKSIKGAFSKEAWQQGLHEATAIGPAVSVSPELAKDAFELERLASMAQDMPDVARGLSSFSGQAHVWTGTTATGLVAGIEGVYGPMQDLYHKVIH